MKNNLKFLLFSTIVASIFSINILNASHCKNQLSNEVNLLNMSLDSVNINQKNKQPQLAIDGSYFHTDGGKQYILKRGKILVGEKNDDTNFLLNHYAKFKIQKDSVLELYDSNMIIQRDGILVNRGEIILDNGSSLIAPPIRNSQDFCVNEHGHRKLKHGVYNKHGIIAIKKGSSAYWKEENNKDEIVKTTIYEGIVDFRDLLRNISDVNNCKSNLHLKLKAVKIILFDSLKNIDISRLNNIEVFKNIYLGKNCQIDGTFDFPKPVSNVVRIKENINKDSVILQKGTIVRESNKFVPTQENIIRNLFGGKIEKLIIKCKQYKEENINYVMKQLLQEFNDKEKITIINTDYTDICNLEYYSNYFNKELTSDWKTTIDKNILPLYKNLFLENKNNKINRYNMYFSFEGNKDISFILPDGEIHDNNYQIAFYRSFQNYNGLLNEKLSTNNNVINNFVQKYSGVSPYLQINENTVYKIAPNDKEQNYVVLRFKKNKNNDFIILGKLILGTKKTPVKVTIDCSYDKNGEPIYAQKLLVKNLDIHNSDSEIIMSAGQTIVLGENNLNNMLEDSSSEAEVFTYNNEKCNNYEKSSNSIEYESSINKFNNEKGKRNKKKYPYNVSNNKEKSNNRSKILKINNSKNDYDYNSDDYKELGLSITFESDHDKNTGKCKKNKYVNISNIYKGEFSIPEEIEEDSK